MLNWVQHLDRSLLWSPWLGRSSPSAKALPPLLCAVLSIDLLRQSETFWIHIVCSCENRLRESIFYDDILGTPQVSITVLQLSFLYAWEGKKKNEDSWAFTPNPFPGC